MNELAQIAETVKAERLRRHLSIETAAGKANMSPMTWRRIERGLPVRHLSMASALRYLDLGEKLSVVALDSGPRDSQATVLGDLVRTSVRASRMRVLSGFGVNAA